jgi:isoquinoline 1-oxidoreductase beta subunit
MEEIKSLNRREFLGTSLTFAGGLLVSFYLPGKMGRMLAQAAEPGAASKVYPPNAFIHIAPDNQITIVISKLEMGQGVNTSMAQLIAEELEADWAKIRSVNAGVDPVYNHPIFGMQITGGSTALASTWDQYRRIGAGMREMLKTTAAKRWGVPVSAVKAANGFVTYGGKKFSYGELADEAGKLPFPSDAPLKPAKDFKIIGKSMKRVDAAAKSNGTAEFGLDVRLPQMLYVMVARPHITGSTVEAFSEGKARAVKGVVDVVRFGEKIAVLATNTHSARKGREALEARWNIPANLQVSTEGFMNDLKANAPKGLNAVNRGDVDGAMAKASRVIEAEYEFPFLAHAAMEPMNCTITYDGKSAEIWSGHQMPTADQATAAKILGLKPDQVKLHVTYAGGSFGRRASKTSDYVVEAAELVKIVKKPLKIVWTREDDMHGGFYRPMNYHKVRIGLDGKKQLAAWDHQIAGHTVMGGSVMEAMIKNGIEETVIEGVSDTHYAIPAFRLLQGRVQVPVTTLWWRSVGHTHTAYVMETAIDELAEATGQDPMEMRLKMLEKSPRHLAVLKLLQQKTGWGKNKAPKGRAWGLAVHESFNSVVGHVAEVSVVEGLPKVHRIWSAVHCGQVVNPEGARTQVEGAIVFGLSSLFQEIKLAGGQVLNNNFIDYPVMRIQEMPKVEVHFVETTDAPTGLGEPGVPPTAPAVANAFYRLTKRRVRKLPFTAV